MIPVLILIVLMAWAIDYINGFHDTANAIATVVSTGVLSARNAIAMAAVLNFVGALLGTHVATTIAKGLADVQFVVPEVIIGALTAAIRMALRAESTPVDTTVAMALAVSWKPLM